VTVTPFGVILDELTDNPPIVADETVSVRAVVLSNTEESEIVGGVAVPTNIIEPFFIDAKVIASVFVADIFKSFKSSVTI
jgi:hypothetical protein